MPINRLTIPKSIMAKVHTQCQKKDNAATGELIRAQKTTLSPKGDAILWEPDPKAVEGMLAILTREETFMRKKGSCSHKLMLETIAVLKTSLPTSSSGH